MFIFYDPGPMTKSHNTFPQTFISQSPTEQYVKNKMPGSLKNGKMQWSSWLGAPAVFKIHSYSTKVY